MDNPRILPKAGEGGPLAVIIQESAEPVFRDKWPDGIDLLCGCGQILAQSVWMDQLWNTSFQCFSCGQISLCDPLPPGTPLPAQTIVLSYDKHSVPKPIELNGLTVVGQAALAQRQREIGERGSTFGNRANYISETLSSERLRQLATRARELLGTDFFRLAESARLSRTSKTPSAVPHGLMRAISLVNEAEQSFATSQPFLNVDAWAELQALVALVDRWHGHPEFEVIRRGLVYEYEHTLILLATATWLEDYGNGVRLHPADSRARSADLRIGTGPRQEAYAEIKAPRALNWPSNPLTRHTAEEIVSRSLKKAGTGKGGQLKAGMPGLLVVGGFHLSDIDMDLLERASNAHLARATRLNIHKSLMGIVLISVGARVKQRFSATGEAQTLMNRSFIVRVSRHPAYTGVAELRINVSTPGRGLEGLRRGRGA
jgi:hypothetical protein